MGSRHLKIVFFESRKHKNFPAAFLIILYYPCLPLWHFLFCIEASTKHKWLVICVPFTVCKFSYWDISGYKAGICSEIYVVLLKKKKKRLTSCTWPNCPMTIHSDLLTVFWNLLTSSYYFIWNIQTAQEAIRLCSSPLMKLRPIGQGTPESKKKATNCFGKIIFNVWVQNYVFLR